MYTPPWYMMRTMCPIFLPPKQGRYGNPCDEYVRVATIATLVSTHNITNNGIALGSARAIACASKSVHAVWPEKMHPWHPPADLGVRPFWQMGDGSTVAESVSMRSPYITAINTNKRGRSTILWYARTSTMHPRSIGGTSMNLSYCTQALGVRS
jgi:hypothetical protein